MPHRGTHFDGVFRLVPRHGADVRGTYPHYPQVFRVVCFKLQSSVLTITRIDCLRTLTFSEFTERAHTTTTL